MKKILSLLLVAVLALSMAACGNNTEPTDAPTTEGTQAPTTEAPTTEATEPSTEAPTTEATASGETTITYFSLSYGETYESATYISAYDDYMGGAYIDYMGAERKVTTLDLSVLADLMAEVENAGLAALVGQDTWDEGDANGSFYIEYSDGTSISAGFSGNVPADYVTAFGALDTWFQTLLADVPAYVPQAQVMGEVDAALLPELQAIVNNSGIQGLDGMAIMGIALDDSFAYSAGLSSAEGIAAGASCQPMMMTNAYSLVIVSLEDEADAASVAADFEASMDWRKWVCVAPSSALIAQKGNMVLCLMGSDTMFAGTRAAMISNGWTIFNELSNPDM